MKCTTEAVGIDAFYSMSGDIPKDARETDGRVVYSSMCKLGEQVMYNDSPDIM